ncbi:MAG TPA: nitroreductase family protein [Acidimicrobiales bacterium]|nr:nitroreductase family protein [Acidimicrobiales bacterium]
MTARSLTEIVRARRMRRVFSPAALERDWLDATLDLARQVPSAGNAQGLEWLVLDTSEATEKYWSITLGERRAGFTHQGLLAAPVLVVAIADPGAYVARYAETDKAQTALGTTADAWNVPYWWVDAGMAIQTLLLVVEDAGLSACFFGLFDHEDAVLAAHGVPAGRRAVGTIAIGHRAHGGETPGRSATRPRRTDVIHRGRW